MGWYWTCLATRIIDLTVGKSNEKALENDEKVIHRKMMTQMPPQKIGKKLNLAYLKKILKFHGHKKVQVKEFLS